MNYFHLYLIIVFAISFVTTPRPKNIRIFNTEYKNGKLFYEFMLLKMKLLEFNLREEEEQLIIGSI